MKGFVRPKKTVLPASAQVPKGNLRVPASQFTHRLKAEQPYFYEADDHGTPDGTLAAGTAVEWLADHGALARIVDDRGLSVFVRRDSLLSTPPDK
jgi:hypothetical protein